MTGLANGPPSLRRMKWAPTRFMSGFAGACVSGGG